MERQRPRTQAEARKARFDETAQRARDIGDSAMRDIDLVLLEQSELREELVERAEQNGGITPDEVEDLLRADVHTSPNFYQ